MRESGDEFYWERVFRGMDDQLAARMGEITSVLDLPGEEKLLDKRVGKSKSGSPLGNHFDSPWEDMERDHDVSPSGSWRGGDGADIYATVERIAGNWLRALAAVVPVGARAAAITILCRNGKLLGYTMDLLDAEWNGQKGDTGIKVALCKRLVAETEAILADLENDVFPRSVAASFQADLQQFREKILTLLFKLRSGK